MDDEEVLAVELTVGVLASEDVVTVGNELGTCESEGVLLVEEGDAVGVDQKKEL